LRSATTKSRDLDLRGDGAGEARKGWVRITAELMAQDAERAGRVAEGPRDLVGGLLLDEERAKRLVHALLGRARTEEEAAARC
jgi:hypothetical protein